MNEVFVLDKEFLFKSNIHEITSISIEHKYDVVDDKCAGEFMISGDYRLHEVSINKEDFSFRVPFETEVRSNVNLDSLEVEITDFTYDLTDDLLRVHIEYQVSGEQNLIEFAETADLDEFLKNNEAEVIDLSAEENRDIAEVATATISDSIIEPDSVSPAAEVNTVVETSRDDEVAPVTINNTINQNNIINSINSEESFITYNVHTVTASDTIESITGAYNININDLKKLNNIDEITVGQKLIIPDETD